MSKPILVTSATGNQGTAVIDAILALQKSEFTILAVTRDSSSSSAKKLISKYPSVKLVQGHQDDAAELFAAAKSASPTGEIWGVYSCQVSMGKGVTHDGEIRQGKAMVDESVKAGVKHFVYGSVDRGGDEKSWDVETQIPHFQSKYLIEHYIREKAGDMGWTIFRPVAFMDNLVPAFPTKVFLASLANYLGPKKLQWIAAHDIGVFAAKAFSNTHEYNQKAIGLAGDELNVEEITKIFAETTTYPLAPTFGVLGSVLTTLVSEVRLMIGWFASDGYGANISKLRGVHPGLMDLKTWILKESKFEKR